MKSFSEWKSTNESTLNSWEREQVWGMIHDIKPLLVPRIKKLIQDFAKEHGGQETDPKHMNIAVSQILLDLTKEYDPAH
jgi:hypothetical protein